MLCNENHFLAPRVVLTLVLSSLVFGHTGSAGEELETDIALDQRLELPGVASEHIGMICPVMVPKT